MRSLASLTLFLTSSLCLTACGRPAPAPIVRLPQAGKRLAPQQPVSVSAVAPDQPRLLAEDHRRAKQWAADAVRVMGVYSTSGGLAPWTASANVYTSPSRAASGNPAVFVARHFGFQAIAQYSEVADYPQLAGQLAALPDEMPVNAASAITAARQAPLPSSTPVGSLPRAFTPSRAILLGSQGGAPEWRLYDGGVRVTVDARSKTLSPAVAVGNPIDPLAQGIDVDIQRAAAAYLPSGLLGPTERREPQASR
ncbi:MAG: hypothetical protein VKP62_03345 [Candidatus Sericytochromatia bacterium]|nr:hypothetical protein [Candidatus Sericytochromatia bacterium]